MSNTGLRRSDRNRQFESVFTNNEETTIYLTAGDSNMQIVESGGGEQEQGDVSERREVVCGLRREGPAGRFTRKRVLDEAQHVKMTEDEDDDFVGEGSSGVRKPEGSVRGTPRRKRSAVKGKGMRKYAVKKKTGKGKNKRNGGGSDGLPSVRTRTSPKPLYGAIQTFSSSQKKCIADMGFGSMLDFKIESLTGKIVYYAVSNFDDKKRELRLGGAKISVSPELVHDILGVPIGGTHLGSIDKQTAEDGVVFEWKKQFEDLEISTVDLREKIAISENADWNFKINFLLLFVNTMAKCKKRGRCDLSLLKYIHRGFEPASIDWCKYIWDALSGCKSYWIEWKKKQFYVGPCTLLTLVYVNGTEVPKFEVKRKRPAIRGWNTENLKKREDTELESGGFGNVLIVDSNAETNNEDNDSERELSYLITRLTTRLWSKNTRVFLVNCITCSTTT